MLLYLHLCFASRVKDVHGSSHVNGEEKMRNITSRCIICGGFFDSKKGLREHKDKDHRITNSKMKTTTVIVTEKTTKSDTAKRHYQE